MDASLTHLLHFNDHGEDFLEQVFPGDETLAHQYCPETKAQSLTRKHPESHTIKKFNISTSSRKLTATVFWDMHGVFLLHFSPPIDTVSSAASQATLKILKRAVQRKRSHTSGKKVLLLHVNARSHTVHATLKLFGTMGAEKFLSAWPTARNWHLRNPNTSPK